MLLINSNYQSQYRPINKRLIEGLGTLFSARLMIFWDCGPFGKGHQMLKRESPYKIPQLF